MEEGADGLVPLRRRGAAGSAAARRLHAQIEARPAAAEEPGAGEEGKDGLVPLRRRGAHDASSPRKRGRRAHVLHRGLRGLAVLFIDIRSERSNPQGQRRCRRLRRRHRRPRHREEIHPQAPGLQMTTAISIEDVRREVKILKALSGHSNLVKFYDSCEDALNVYIIMELCEGGELLDRILSRGGRYNEGDAKIIVEQILNVVAFCHLQGVVHRDLKPENFLFSTKDEHSPMKIIDFGLSDFIRPDERLNDIVGSAYYVAPEVLHRSYSTEADMWSIGVITYILLCGSRPFWARTESGIFRSVLRADPNFDDTPWQSVSPEAKDFVKRLLNKDYRKRMTAAQAL